MAMMPDTHMKPDTTIRTATVDTVEQIVRRLIQGLTPPARHIHLPQMFDEPLRFRAPGDEAEFAGGFPCGYDLDPQMIGRQQVCDAVGPFDQTHAIRIQ